MKELSLLLETLAAKDIRKKALDIIDHYTVDPMLLPSGNPFKCHEEVLYFQLLIPPKRFDIYSL